MDAKQVSESLDKAVVVEGKGNGMIIGYIKGWVEVEMPDTTVIKCRAKELTLLPEDKQPEVQSFDVGPVEDFEEDHNIKPLVEGEDNEIHCPACENVFHTKRTDNFKCPKCKFTFRIRLKPNKDNYVIGLASTVSGRDTMDINDNIAEAMRGQFIEDVYVIATGRLISLPEETWFTGKNRVAFKKWKEDRPDTANYDLLLSFLWNKFSHLNLGMQRMSLGNLVRAANKRAE